MHEMREEHLKTGQSDWLAWSAAVGMRGAKKATRNFVLKYFCKGSPMNNLIGNCIGAMPNPVVATRPIKNGKAGKG
jgi:hypothetical protein